MIMSKIPKNLSDKDMLKDYVEEKSLEEQLMEKEAQSRKKDKSDDFIPAVSYLTPDIVRELAGQLMTLKMQLAQEGVEHYKMNIRRDGHDIILSPAIPKMK